MSVTQYYNNLRAVRSFSRFTMAPVEKQQASSLSGSHYLIRQTSCVWEGARLGRIKKRDTSERENRQCLTSFNQLSSMLTATVYLNLK